MAIAAVILAAGASSRMGRPKALLPWRGRTFVAHLVSAARTAGCEPVVVVQGATDLTGAGIDADAIRVTNLDWTRGPRTSLACGLDGVERAASDPPPSGVLILTVDRPHLRTETLSALLDAHRRAPDRVWQARSGGRRGHPLILSTAAVQALRGAPPDATLRDVLRSPAIAPTRDAVDLDDPAIHDNLDRPEDLERLPP